MSSLASLTCIYTLNSGSLQGVCYMSPPPPPKLECLMGGMQVPHFPWKGVRFGRLPSENNPEKGDIVVKPQIPILEIEGSLTDDQRANL